MNRMIVNNYHKCYHYKIGWGGLAGMGWVEWAVWLGWLGGLVRMAWGGLGGVGLPHFQGKARQFGHKV